MLFVKNTFRRLLGNAPSNRARSANPHENHTEPSVLTGDSQSRINNSLESLAAEEANKHLTPIKEMSGHSPKPTGMQRNFRSNRFRSHQIPQIVSLAAARKRHYERHHSVGPAAKNTEASVVQSLNSIQDLNHQESNSKLSANSSQDAEALTKAANPEKRIRRIIKRQSSVSNSIGNLDNVKDLPRIKSNVSKSSVLDEKVLRPVSQLKDELPVNQERELPGSSASTRAASSNSHPVNSIIARSEAYVQKNRQDLAKALKNIEQKENQSNRKKVPSISVQNSFEAVNPKGSQSDRNRSRAKQGPASFELPNLQRRGSHMKEHPKLPIYPRPVIKANLSIVEEKLDSARLEDKNNFTIRTKLRNFEQELKDFSQNPEMWNQREHSVDNELAKVDRLTRRNSNAMADLVSVREDLMQLGLKHDLKSHRNRRKLMKMNQ